MPLRIIRQDITKIAVDAIVNAANESLLGGGGVDGAIHKVAGKELLEECQKLGGCQAGCVKSTKGYNLPAKFVIHAVGPIYDDGLHGEAELLTSCYKHALIEAKRLGCKSVAFPLISSGAFCYPKKEALRIAINTITDFLFENRMEVYICIWSDEVCSIANQLYPDLEEYISSHYVTDHTDELEERYRSRMLAEKEFRFRNKKSLGSPVDVLSESVENCCVDSYFAEDIVKEAKAEYENRFPELLKTLITKKGLTSGELCTRSNITKQLLSDLKKTEYHTRKDTVLALSIGMKLDKQESDALMGAAGYSYSNGDMRDILARYFIKNRLYNIFEVNAILYDEGLPLLGTKGRQE